MAFEYLNDYTDSLANRYKKTEDLSYLSSLTSFYEIILKKPKFKSQRDYCKSVIKKINEPYYKGYFKIK